MPLNHSVKEVKLKNGIKGLLVDVPGSSVLAYGFHFRAGYHYAQSKDRQQTAHIMEHLAFKGIEGYPTPELFSRVFTKNGAYRNAYTSEYDMEYVIDAPISDWGRILELQKEVIAKPLYKSEAFEAEKRNVVEELTGQAGNHRRLLSMTINRAMGETSLLDAEKITTVDAVTIEDVHEHHGRTHVSQNLRFCFTGDLSRYEKDIVTMLEEWSIGSGERLEIPTKTYHRSEPVTILRKDLPSITFIFRIAINEAFNDSQKVAAQILNQILTGSFHSRIFGEARKQGLCYGLSADMTYSVDGVSYWDITGQVMAKNAEALFTLIRKHLQAVVAGGISREEVDDAKQFLVGRHQMHGQNVRDINDWYGSKYFDYEQIQDLNSLVDVIQSIQKSDVENVMKALCDSGVWTLGTIGNIKTSDTKKLAEIVTPLFKEEDKVE